MNPVFASSEGVPSPSKKSHHEYPCLSCGASVVFDIKGQKLKCEYCGFEKLIDDDRATARENSYEEFLKNPIYRNPSANPMAQHKVLSCGDCQATITVASDQIGLSCPYCTSPLHEDLDNQCSARIPVDGMLPFQVSRDKARRNLERWVKSLWFAPNDFQRKGIQGKFNGMYTPFFTFDSHTSSQYRGQRGEDYTVTVGSGDNERRETRTRWYSVSGTVREFFDDVLIGASRDLSQDLIRKLEPWPLNDLKDYSPDYLPGFNVRTYSLSLTDCFGIAKQRIKAAIENLVKQDIGGDHQRIHSLTINHHAVSYKHLLLPIWILSYRYQGKVYQVAVNACTGEVSGQRPWSWVKITLTAATLLVTTIVTVLYLNDPLIFKDIQYEIQQLWSKLWSD